MKYFGTIMSFADLKRQYRKLAIANHPDKGGSTQAMQQKNILRTYITSTAGRARTTTGSARRKSPTFSANG